jgi:hypothetical protein
VVDCFRADPLIRFDAPSSEDEESFETSDKDEPLGEMPGRCDVRYGPRALDVRRGSGDCARLWLLGGDGVLPGCCPANRSSHMMDPGFPQLSLAKAGLWTCSCS